MRLRSRHWGESGFTTWTTSLVIKPFRVNYFKKDYDGDTCRMFTIGVFRRVFRVIYWRKAK